GGRIAIFTNNDSAYRAAGALHRAGAQIAAIVDVRPQVSAAALALVQETRAEHLPGHALVATRGGQRLTSISVRRYDIDRAEASGPLRTIDVDCLAVSGGWSPAIHLASQAGGAARWDERLQAFLPPQPAQSWVGAGAFTGAFTTQEAIVEGLAAGAAAARVEPSREKPPHVGSAGLDVTPAPVFEIREPGKAFVD